MLLIRPLLAANEGRQHRVHAVVFFILLVGNVGGALSPLGDPPLFIGFLKGVDFFWTTRALLVPTSRCASCCSPRSTCSIHCFARREPPPIDAESRAGPFGSRARVNLLLLAGVVGAVLLSGAVEPGHRVRRAGHARRAAERWCATSLLVALALVSLALTPRGRPRAQRLPLGTDRRGRQALRRHLHHDHSGDCDAAAGQRRRAWRPGRAGHRRRRRAARSRCTSGRPACCPRFSTTRRPTSCSSISRAAMRRR